MFEYFRDMIFEPENMSHEQLLELHKKQQEIVENLQARKENLESENKQLSFQVAEMQFQLDQMKRLLYGSKRERFVKDVDENQLTLPFEVEEQQEPEKEKEVITYVREKKKRENHPGRLTLPSHLPVEETIIEPEEDTTGLKCIGKEVTDQLEITPAKLFIKRTIRLKYIKPLDDKKLDHVGVIAPLPTFPIEKGIAGPGLLAQIMIDKFVDHLPIYRQIERFKRDSIKISSSTINGWQEAVCNLLEPLYNTLKNRILQQGYLQVDETPIKVLDKTKKSNIHQGYYWIYHSPLEKTVQGLFTD